VRSLSARSFKVRHVMRGVGIQGRDMYLDSRLLEKGHDVVGQQ
jgi:hypothetical protein